MGPRFMSYHPKPPSPSFSRLLRQGTRDYQMFIISMAICHSVRYLLCVGYETKDEAFGIFILISKQWKKLPYSMWTYYNSEINVFFFNVAGIFFWNKMWTNDVDNLILNISLFLEETTNILSFKSMKFVWLKDCVRDFI